MTKNITLTIDPQINGRDISLSATLHNNENKLFYIHENALDAMNCGASFKILNGPSAIECHIICMRRAPGSINWLEIQPEDTVTTVNQISNYCNFRDAESGTYEAYFSTGITFYIDHNHTYDFSSRFEIPITLEIG